jgi:heme/copper-type cytochrome/quinol oxidase subunit 2
MRIVMTLVIAALMALLVAAVWYAYGLWNALESADMPTWMYVAMGGGIIFSLIIGCGLMALVFYSNRQGSDDRANDFHD